MASGRFPPTPRCGWLRYFETSPELWITMQAGHDLSKARAEIGKQIAAEVRARKRN